MSASLAIDDVGYGKILQALAVDHNPGREELARKLRAIEDQYLATATSLGTQILEGFRILELRELNFSVGYSLTPSSESNLQGDELLTSLRDNLMIAAEGGVYSVAVDKVLEEERFVKLVHSLDGLLGLSDVEDRKKAGEEVDVTYNLMIKNYGNHAKLEGSLVVGVSRPEERREARFGHRQFLGENVSLEALFDTMYIARLVRYDLIGTYGKFVPVGLIPLEIMGVASRHLGSLSLSGGWFDEYNRRLQEVGLGITSADLVEITGDEEE